MTKPDGQVPWGSVENRLKLDPGGTKARILRAATELIGEQGWGGVTTRSVAERAGVLHGVVSYHFDGKADLLRQAAVLGAIECLAEPVEILFAAPSVPAGLRALARWLAGGPTSLSELALLAETMLAAQRDPELARLTAGLLADFRSVLAERLGETDVAATDAMLLAATLDGLILHRVLDPDLDPVPTLDRLADLMEHALPHPRKRRGQPTTETEVSR